MNSSKRLAKMDENTSIAMTNQPTARVTRARAKALGTSVGLPPLSKISYKPDQKRSIRLKSKRPMPIENKASTSTTGLPHKRRAALGDVSNIFGENMYADCIDATEVQTRKKCRTEPIEKHVKMDAYVSMVMEEEDVKMKLAEDLSKIRMVEQQETTFPINLDGKKVTEESMHHSIRECSVADQMHPLQALLKHAGLQNCLRKEENSCENSEPSDGLQVVDIDCNLKDPQLCSLYVSDIYDKIRLTEIVQRPSNDYMTMLQRDITPSMRGILIDWLVEVSEEYKLVPDTLYLTVNLIDRFLSKHYTEKHKLQLLGVTCMLIASKYEEIVAPRVEEFCFITDNTYTRGEVPKLNQIHISNVHKRPFYYFNMPFFRVLKMESLVLNLLRFQLSVPTTKTFLRRYIVAAQASYKVSCVELEFLANYFAELSLLEYRFLNFLPSLIAASAVFLARWTLTQSDHPWNPTLEHYTNYKASDMKTTVLALEELQLNTNECSLNSIREKYRNQKFKCVATLSSPKRVESVFS